MKDTSILCDSERDTALRVLGAAFRMWNNCATLRKTRLRNKRFTYGNQWCDLTYGDHGKVMTEYERFKAKGKEPITNNLMRQLVKSVVGRFRKNHRGEELDEVSVRNHLMELDSRGLEEFLISGCCVQRIDEDVRNRGLVRVDSVNINRFFVNGIEDHRGWDVELVGEIHEMNLAELIMRLADGDRTKAAAIREIYSGDLKNRIADTISGLGISVTDGNDFWYAHSGKLKAIEVWTLESVEMLKCHDRRDAVCYKVRYNEKDSIDAENKRRVAEGEARIETEWSVGEVWRCRWFSPSGDVLAVYDSPYRHRNHPYVMKFYPLIDGEIHSFVEDLIDQQKYVNRLITTIDDIMNASAKGVLLFPDTGLPNGFTWKDIQKMWRSCDGVIPFAANKVNFVPQQVSTNATNIGAYEMLQLQMKLFEEISGVSGALQGKVATNSTGAELYKNQVANADIALTDIYDTYEEVRKERNEKIAAM